MKTKKLFILVLLSFPIFSSAREGIQQDFSFNVERSMVDITVEKDGSYEVLATEEFRVLNDEAKKYFGPYKIHFDPSTEDITILEAFIENAGTKIEVDKNNIQKSNMAAKKDGIVNQSEIAIPYSQIKPGSKIFLKLLTKYKAGPFGDYFNFKNNYGDVVPEVKDIVRIKSPKELFYKVQDPSHVLYVKTYRDQDGKYILESQLVRPHGHIAVNEIGHVSSEETTSLKVSNVNSWEKFRQLINDKFATTQLQDPLPSALQAVITKIPKDASFDKKVDAALIYITSNYDYLGDWRGAGGVVPKRVEKIVADHFGDCKDFSTLLIKMLRAMNIKADYALVQRSYAPSLLSADSIPLMDYFNHMIVRVENGGKIYWIDPTNQYSIGLETRADISGRNAFALGDSKISLERIPEIDFNKQVNSATKLYQFDSAESANVDVIYKIEGETAKITLDGLKNKNSVEVQELLMKAVAKSERHAVMSFDLQDTKEKSYYDLHIKAKYKASRLMIKDKNAVNGKIELPSLEYLKTFLYFRQDGVGSADIRLMPKVTNTYYYKNIFLAGPFPKVCQIKSDWVEASRKIETKDTGFVLKDQIEFKIPLLTKEIYANRSFSSIAGNLNECFVENYAEFTFNTKKHTDNLTVFEENLAKLSVKERMDKRIQKSYDIMDNRGKEKKTNDLVLEDARLLLEKNLNEKLNDSESLRAMSSYYSDNAFLVGNTFIDSELNQSLEYINRAIVADPNNLAALIDKVRVLRNLKLFDASKELLTKSAIGIDASKIDYVTLRKFMSAFFRIKDKDNAFKYFDLALSRAPEDRDRAVLYADRADYHMNTEQYPQCVDDYEQSLKFNNKKAWSYGNVAICYNDLQKFDLAIDRAKKAISIMDYGAAHNVLADSYLGKGRAYYLQSKFKESEENYQLAIMEFPRADIYLNLFHLYLTTGRKEKAEEAKKKALLAADETYTIGWVRSTLETVAAQYEKEGAVKRKVAQENKEGSADGALKK